MKNTKTFLSAKIPNHTSNAQPNYIQSLPVWTEVIDLLKNIFSASRTPSAICNEWFGIKRLIDIRRINRGRLAASRRIRREFNGRRKSN